MVYYSKENVRFAKHFGQDLSVFEVNFINEYSNNRYTFTLEDTANSNTHYLFNLTNVNLPDGTYKYIFGTDDKIETGIIQVGDYKSHESVYTKENTTEVIYEG